MKSSVKAQMTMPDHELESLPVVQKLVVVFGDGTTLMFGMNKSFELDIVQYHKFNYDKKGYWFNSKKVPGKSLYVVYV